MRKSSRLKIFIILEYFVLFNVRKVDLKERQDMEYLISNLIQLWSEDNWIIFLYLFSGSLLKVKVTFMYIWIPAWTAIYITTSAFKSGKSYFLAALEASRFVFLDFSFWNGGRWVVDDTWVIFLFYCCSRLSMPWLRKAFRTHVHCCRCPEKSTSICAWSRWYWSFLSVRHLVSTAQHQFEAL